MSITEKIVLSIVGMNKISISYKDEKENKISTYRFILPHLLGIHRKTENKILSAYYLPEDEGVKEGWKTFLLENIYDVELTDEKFTIESGYNSQDSRMRTILANV